MLPSNGRYSEPEYDYHIRNDELRILLEHIKDTHGEYSWQYILACLVWARGMRISEALFVNFQDFPLRLYGDFTTMNFREAKTNKIRSNEIIVEPVACMIKEHIVRNPLILSHYDGYIFPHRNGSLWHGAPVMKTETAGSYMCKWRNALAEKFPEFLDKYPHKNWNCPQCHIQWSEQEHFEQGLQDLCRHCGSVLVIHTKWTYRIGWHSLRRNFEDNGLDYSGDNALFVKEMMHYSKVQTVMHYTSKKRLREKIPDFMENCISPMFNDFRAYDPDQTRLMAYMEQ